MRRQRTLVTAAAAALVAATIGLASVLAVQARANGALKKANALLAESVRREQTANADLAAAAAQIQARFDLALEAIKTFHTGVAEDVLLKNDNLQPVRDRLLEGAAEFYKRLTRPTLGPVRPEITASTGASLLRDGQASEPARRDGAGDRLPPASPGRAPGTGRRGGCRWRGEGRSRPQPDRPGRCLEGVWANGRGAGFVRGSSDAAGRPDPRPPDVPQFLRHLAMSQNDIGILLSETGKPAEAMASYHAALAIQQKLADANATVVLLQRLWG